MLLLPPSSLRDSSRRAISFFNMFLRSRREYKIFNDDPEMELRSRNSRLVDPSTGLAETPGYCKYKQLSPICEHSMHFAFNATQ